MLVNLSKGTVITKRVEFARSFFERALGLMFKKEFDGALVFRIRGPTYFHGFFCRFPILLLCLKGGKVVCKKMLLPWRIERVEGDTVIELDGRRSWAVDVGDEVTIVEGENGRGW